MTSSVEEILKNITPHATHLETKVTVVGVGAVGMGVATAMLFKEITKNLVLIDMDEKKVSGEVMDLEHTAPFLNNVQISGGSDYALSKDSKICIVSAGVRQQEGETRLDLVQRNVQVFKKIIPALVQYSPNAILMIVTNPCDILTYVAWKLSGFPTERVFGSGCDLDSARFRVALGQKLEVASSSIHGWIIGEHGDSSVPVWSAVNIAGVFLNEIHPEIGTASDPDRFIDVHKTVVNGAYEVIKLKGYTSWAIGYTVANIVEHILSNVYAVHSLSVNVKGYHGINEDVFLSLPVVLGGKGITDIVMQNLTEDETKKIQESANILISIQKEIEL